MRNQGVPSGAGCYSHYARAWRRQPDPSRARPASGALIPRAKTEVLEACGHFRRIERPGVIRKALDLLRTC
jgi:hypothetical protein